MLVKFNTSKLVRILVLVAQPALLLIFLASLSSLVLVENSSAQISLGLGLVYTGLLVLPILAARHIYTTTRSRFEFSCISQLATLILTFAFVQINNRPEVTTTLDIFQQFGVQLNSGVNAALLILALIHGFVHYDLLFGKFISEFRIRFSTAFSLQIVLAFSFFSYIYLLGILRLGDQFYRSVGVETLASIPAWVIVMLFSAISSIISIYYFGRGNILLKSRPLWAKIAWRLLIFFVHLQLAVIIAILPHNYWWKVLFYILIWDFLIIPLARIYKQKTDFFWEKLKLSLVYHVLLFLIVFWISPK